MSKLEAHLSASPFVKTALEYLSTGDFENGLTEWRKAMDDRGFCFENCEQYGKAMDDKNCCQCFEGLLLTLALYSGQQSENEYVDLLERLREWVANENSAARTSA